MTEVLLVSEDFDGYHLFVKIIHRASLPRVNLRFL